MRVIKKGSENKSFGKEMICKGVGVGESGGCGAVLHVMPRDIKHAVYSDYGGGSDVNYWFVCPECGVKSYISANVFSK